MAGTYTMLNFASLYLLGILSGLVAALSPISIKGTKLYDNDGNQFFMKGVVYVSANGRDDPLANTAQCQIDAVLMKAAGINMVYIYAANPELDHDGCMQALADQGIYVWLQLSDFPRITGQTQTGPLWTMPLYTSWAGIIDVFAGYDNLLALGIGQEVITVNATSTPAAPALKAAARDLHAFTASRGYRSIPLSYSAADVSAFRLLTARYLTCASSADDSDPSATIDLLGLNVFSTDSCAESSWRDLHSELSELPIPVVVSEMGCRTSVSTRDFSEVALLLGDDELNDVFSGVSVFEWALREEGGYGLVQYVNGSSSGSEEGEGGTEVLEGYETLSSVLGDVKPTGTAEADYTPANTARAACPTMDIAGGWLVDGDAVLPTIDGLQTGTVTAKTTVTTATSPGSKVTGGAGGGQEADGSQGQGQGQLGDVSDEGGNGLSTGAIAGIVVGCVIGVLALVTGIFMCLRRRKRTAEHQELPGNEAVAKQPPTYGYPLAKVELPTQVMAAEMGTGAPHSGWKMPGHEAREDSPTVTELADNNYIRTTPYELEGNQLAGTGDWSHSADSPTGAWRVSPVSAGGKYM